VYNGVHEHAHMLILLRSLDNLNASPTPTSGLKKSSKVTRQ